VLEQNRARKQLTLPVLTAPSGIARIHVHTACMRRYLWFILLGVFATGFSARAQVPTTFDHVATEHFDIQFTPRAKAAAHILERDLEEIRAECIVLLQRNVESTTTIRIGQGRDEFEAISPHGKPPGYAIALAWPDENLILFDATTLSRPDARATLRHELFHVLLGQLGTGWPRWFQEGLAQHLTRERDFKMSHFETLSQAVNQDKLFSWAQLTNSFPENTTEVEVAYAQSAEFVGFLRSKHSFGEFQVLYDRMQQGDAFEKAFGIAFHSSLSVEDELFRKELPKRFPWWAVLLATEGIVWAVASILLIFAHRRRRNEFEKWRTAQIHVETLEDLADCCVSNTALPANADVDWFDAFLSTDENKSWNVTSNQISNFKVGIGSHPKDAIGHNKNLA
jgi:hypothetical protein